MTTRRLSDEIEYSQPVLYSHFRNRQAIVTAVAEEGFAELVDAVRQAADVGASAAARLEGAGAAYLRYAAENPAVYRAMFELPTDFAFADLDTPPSVAVGFDVMRSLVTDAIPNGDDADTVTEVLWSSLHGLAALQSAHRLRPGYQAERLRVIVNYLVAPSRKNGA